MALRIMKVAGCRVPGGVALVLCDDEGRLLPCQNGGILEQEEGEESTFTVTFGINGSDVILDCGDANEDQVED